MSLFEDKGQMRTSSGGKSKLATAVSDACSVPKKEFVIMINSSLQIIVLDGGLLLHTVPWKK